MESNNNLEFKSFMLDNIFEYENVIENRKVEFLKPQLFNINIPNNVDFDIIPEGSIVGVVLKKDSSLLNDLVSSLKKESDYLNLKETIKKINKNYIDNLFDGDNINGIKNISVLAEIRYGSKTLAKGISIDNNNYGDLSYFAYSGGKINESDFKFLQFVNNNTTPDLELILIKREPQLSDLELEILSKIPDDQTELNIAPIEAAAITKTAVEFAKKVIEKVVEKTPVIKEKVVEYTKEVAKVVTAELVTKTIQFAGFDYDINTGLKINKENINEHSSINDLIQIRKLALLNPNK